MEPVGERGDCFLDRGDPLGSLRAGPWWSSPQPFTGEALEVWYVSLEEGGLTPAGLRVFFCQGKAKKKKRARMVNERKTLSVSASCSSSFPSLFSSSLLSIPPRCSFDSPNVRVYPCPHRPVARRGGLVAPRLQRRELPQQQRVRFAKGVAAAVAGAAAAAVGGVDVLLVPVEAIRLNDRGRVAGWDKRERRQREREAKARGTEGRQQQQKRF